MFHTHNKIDVCGFVFIF